MLVNDDRSLIKICEFIIHEKYKLAFSESDIALIDKLIMRHINYNHHLEVIWLLYLRISLNKFNVEDEIIKVIIKSDNDLAKIIIIEEYSDIIKDHTEILMEIINNASSWILCYVLFFNNHINLSEFSKKTGINANCAFYNQLKKSKISIYKKIYNINNLIYLLNKIISKK